MVSTTCASLKQKLQSTMIPRAIPRWINLWRTQEPVLFSIAKKKPSLFICFVRKTRHQVFHGFNTVIRLPICFAIKLKTEFLEISPCFRARREINCFSQELRKCICQVKQVLQNQAKLRRRSSAQPLRAIFGVIEGQQIEPRLVYCVDIKHGANSPNCPPLYLYCRAENLGRKPLLRSIAV